MQKCFGKCKCVMTVAPPLLWLITWCVTTWTMTTCDWERWSLVNHNKPWLEGTDVKHQVGSPGLVQCSTLGYYSARAGYLLLYCAPV